MKLLSLTLEFFTKLGIDAATFLKNLTTRFLGLLQIDFSDSNAFKQKTQLEDEIFEMVKNDPHDRICSLIFVLFELFQNHFKCIMFKELHEGENFSLLKLYETARPNPSNVAKNISISKILHFSFEELNRRRINKEESEENDKIISLYFKQFLMLLKLVIDSKIGFNLENGKIDKDLINKYISIILYYASKSHHIKLEVIESNLLFKLNEVKNEASTTFSQIASFESLYKLREVMSFDREYIYFNCCHKILDCFYESGCNTSKFRTAISSEQIQNVEKAYKLSPQKTQEAFWDLCYMEKKNNKVYLKKG